MESREAEATMEPTARELSNGVRVRDVRATSRSVCFQSHVLRTC